MSLMLDTNICIAILRRRPAQVLDRLRALLEAGVTPALSTIVRFELALGPYQGTKRALNEAELRHFLTPMTVLPFEANDAEVAAAVHADLAAKGLMIGPYDILIAGHALARGLTLVTGNIKEFARVPGLHLESWST